VREDRVVTFRDLFLLLLGAIVGAVISSWYAAGTSRATRFLAGWRIRRRAVKDREGATVKRILTYYSKRGLSRSLYQPQHIGAGGRVPILVDDSWLFSHRVDPGSDSLIFVSDAKKKEFHVDMRAIRRRQAQGARIFDGELLYLKSVNSGANGDITLLADVCGYYAWATLSLRLEAELRWPRLRLPLRDRYFQDALSAVSAPVQPLGIGCTCVTVFRGRDGLYVAVQNRSSEVMNDSNIRTVLPTFGLENCTVAGQASRRSLLYYNYFREFAEEFFNLESVIQASLSRRVDPDWIFELPEIRIVEREALADRFWLECTGMSVNPIGGFVNVALLAISTSESFFDSVRKRVLANWEAVEGGRASPPIEFVGLQSPQLDAWVNEGVFSPSSIFALDRARERLYAAAKGSTSGTP
jgi:hypothetical protein